MPRKTTKLEHQRGSGGGGTFRVIMMEGGAGSVSKYRASKETHLAQKSLIKRA